jgi:hypothetical protein
MGNGRIVRYTLSSDPHDVNQSSDNLDYSDNNAFSDLKILIELQDFNIRKILDVPDLRQSDALRSVAELEAFIRSLEHASATNHLTKYKNDLLSIGKARSLHGAALNVAAQERRWFPKWLSLFNKKSDGLTIGRGNLLNETYHLSDDPSVGKFNFELHDLEGAVYSGRFSEGSSQDEAEDLAFTPDLPAWPKDKRNEPYEI